MKPHPHVCSISFFFQVYSGMDYESHGCTTETFYGPDDADKAIADAKAYAAKGKEILCDDWVAVFRCEIGGNHSEHAAMPGMKQRQKVEIFSARIQYLSPQPDLCTGCHRSNPISSEPWENRKGFHSEHLGFCRDCLARNLHDGLSALQATEPKTEEKESPGLTCDACGHSDPYMAPELAGAQCRNRGPFGCLGTMRTPEKVSASLAIESNPNPN